MVSGTSKGMSRLTREQLEQELANRDRRMEKVIADAIEDADRYVKQLTKLYKCFEHMTTTEDGELTCISSPAKDRLYDSLVVVPYSYVAGKDVPFVRLGKNSPPLDKHTAFYDRTRHDANYWMLFGQKDVDHFFKGIPKPVLRSVAEMTRGNDGGKADDIEAQKREEKRGVAFMRDSEKYKCSKKELVLRVHTENLRVRDEEFGVACPVVATSLPNMDKAQVYQYLTHHIRGQDSAVETITNQLMKLKGTISDPKHRKVFITAAGSTGTGKTDLVTLIRTLCHMGRNDEYKDAFHEVSFSSCLDQSHGNLITGVGPGYVGHGKDCLVDYLIRMQKCMQKWDEDPTTNLKPPVKMIMLCLDEMDKGSTAMYNALNPLLDQCRLKSASGSEFILADDVFLLIISTSNFAKDYFNQLEDREYHSKEHARKEIQLDMRRKGIAECDIGRMGHIVSFFALSNLETSKILHFKLREHLATGALSLPMMKCRLSFPEHDQERFVEYLMMAYNKIYGIRPLIEIMIDQISTLMTSVTEYVSKHLRIHVYPLPPEDRPTLGFNVSRSHNITIEDTERDPIFAAAMKDFFNERRIRHCINEELAVARFTVDHPYFLYHELPCIHILDPVNNRPAPLLPVQPEGGDDEGEGGEEEMMYEEEESHSITGSTTTESTLMRKSPQKISSFASGESSEFSASEHVSPKQKKVSKKRKLVTRDYIDSFSTTSSTTSSTEGNEMKMDWPHVSVEEEEGGGEEEEEVPKPAKKKRKHRKNEEIREEDEGKEEQEVVIERENGHAWVRDKTKSNRKTNVYRCDCHGALSPPHYYRKCSRGDKCKGNGRRMGASKGSCARCAEIDRKTKK